MKILIIEDEVELAKSMEEYLSEENYLCEIAFSFKEAMDKIFTFNYDCILLDITLPDGNGLKILEELKKENKQDGVIIIIIIIIISAKNSIDDKIKGLHIGADDYLTKPFHLSELTARIYSLIRRKQFNNSNIIIQDELEIDVLAKTVSFNNKLIELTKKEFDLLIYFIGNKNRVLSKIPFIVWVSNNNKQLKPANNTILSQNNVFHSVLNFLSIDSPIYDENMNIFKK
ncbi:response regulator transcription factor [Chishuiella changwenlii]|uniref:response regulator transcription factor n=1 Tax=Chishuiella changwenlii TaxID=1434701 RepID=UPI002FD9BECB